MEIRLNLKQVAFIGVWMVILVVALVLSMTEPYMNTLQKAKTFGLLLAVFGVSFSLLVMGLDGLSTRLTEST